MISKYLRPMFFANPSSHNSSIAVQVSCRGVFSGQRQSTRTFEGKYDYTRVWTPPSRPHHSGGYLSFLSTNCSAIGKCTKNKSKYPIPPHKESWCFAYSFAWWKFIPRLSKSEKRKTYVLVLMESIPKFGRDDLGHNLSDDQSSKEVTQKN